MGKPQVFEIVLPLKGTVVFPGQTLQGYINLEHKDTIKLSSIKISVRGRAFVHWTDQKIRGPGEPRFRDTRHHSATEDYFEYSLILHGPSKTTHDRLDKFYLPAGQYNYPFQCRMPVDIPCSFEGEYGYVRYWVKASIEKGREIIYKTILPFTVISHLDLNSVPDSNAPAQETDEKSLCCLCCTSEPISASLVVPKRGYVPGERISFAAEISNMSSRRINCYSVELKMTTIFKTPTESRCTTQRICKVMREQKLGKGETDMWTCNRLLVPPVPPSCLIGCSIISIKYTLELRIDPFGPAFDLTLPIEVIIGTVPHHTKYECVESNVRNAAGCSCSNNVRYSNEHNATPAQRKHVGLPVLPIHGQYVNNAMYQKQSTNPIAFVSPTIAGSQDGQRQGSRHPSSAGSQEGYRSPSRASNAASTASSTSVQTSCGEGQRGRPRGRWLNDVQDITSLSLKRLRRQPEPVTNGGKESWRSPEVACDLMAHDDHTHAHTVTNILRSLLDMV